MARITFFSTPEPRGYNYKPRYYDERKERLEELYKKYGKTPEGMKQAEAELDRTDPQPRKSDHYVPGQSIRGAFTRAKAAEPEDKPGKTTLRRIITLVTIAIAFVLAYYLTEGFIRLLR